MARTPTARHHRAPRAQPAREDAPPEAVPNGLVWVSDSEPGHRRVRHGDQNEQ